MAWKGWKKSQNYKRLRVVRRGRSKAGGKYTGIQRVFRPFEPAIHRFKEITQLDNIVLTGGSLNSGLITFALKDLTNLSVYQNMFDFFRIVGVKLQLVPAANNLDVNYGTNSVIPTVYMAPVRDSAYQTPTSEQQVYELDGVKALRLTNPYKCYLRNPICRLTDTAGVINLNFMMNNNKVWLGTGNTHAPNLDGTALPHYGFAWACDLTGLNTGFATTYKVIATYYIKFKEQD